jgi:O-antigen/teichoic acid export membrane protein
LSSSSQYIDGFIITSKFSQSDFAVFQYGARELPLAMLLANSLSVAMVPRFAQSDLSSPLAEMKSETYRLGVLLFPVTIVCLLLSHWAFPVFFNQGFAESATVFNVYLMLILSRLAFPQTILMGQRMNRPIVMASLFEIIVNVSVSIWFANLFGIVGVAYGTFVAYVFEKIYLAVVVYRTKRIGIDRYMPLLQYISFSVLLIIVFIIVEFVVY